MHPSSNTLTRQNIEETISGYLELIEELGEEASAKRGLELLYAIKRDALPAGPYPGVTLFEAANRILTDLVVLYGVRWLLHEGPFRFEAFTVEYGHQNNNDFDIQATDGTALLIGEAFNVAPSFFGVKKSAMLKKLRGSQAQTKLLVFNSDAVLPNYQAKPRLGEHFLIVDVGTTQARLMSGPNS